MSHSFWATRYWTDRERGGIPPSQCTRMLVQRCSENCGRVYQKIALQAYQNPFLTRKAKNSFARREAAHNGSILILWWNQEFRHLFVDYTGTLVESVFGMYKQRGSPTL